MPDSKPAILIVQPHLGVLSPFLEPDFTVWRLWEAPPLEATQKIGALVVAGEFPLDTALAEHLPNLGLIASFNASYEGVDIAWASARGLKVSHSPGVNHEDVADQAIGLMLAAWRGLVEGDAIVRRGLWRPTERRLTISLGGHRLGVVGLGDVGEAVARRAEAFGLSVAWWGPDEGADAPWPRSETLEALAEESDILVVASSTGAEPSHLIDAAVIEALGPSGLLVNVAQGGLVDEEALIAALK